MKVGHKGLVRFEHGKNGSIGGEKPWRPCVVTSE